MAPDTKTPIAKPEDDLRDLPKWARRYAQNRTLPVVVFLGISVFGFCMFGGLSYLTAWAYMADQRFLAAASMLVLCAFGVWWLWFSFVGGNRIMRQISERLYRGEGSVSVGLPLGPEAMSQRPTLIAFVFMFCVLASVGLGLLGFLPISLMQPISALYVVPFLCYLGMKLRRVGVGSPFMFLWPALYGLHAILQVARVPVRFWGEVRALDVGVPMVAYGLIAALAGHMYSRIALRRLRRLASSPDVADEPEG